MIINVLYPSRRCNNIYISYILVVQSLHKRWFKVYTSLQATCTCVLYCGPILQVNGSVYAKSGGRWSCSAGNRSTQRLFCTKSSMHGISIINTRWSLTTEIVNIVQSFYCLASKNCNKGFSAVSYTDKHTLQHTKSPPESNEGKHEILIMLLKNKKKEKITSCYNESFFKNFLHRKMSSITY